MDNKQQLNEDTFIKELIKLLEDLSGVNDKKIFQGPPTNNIQEYLASLSQLKPQRLDQSEIESKVKTLIKSFKNTKFEIDEIPYNKITKAIFENLDNDSWDIIQPMLFTDIINIAKRELENDSYQYKKFFKILRHIDLAITQMRTLNKLNAEGIQLLEKKTQEIQNLTKNTEAKLGNMEKKVEGMISHFITILGIFAAVLMGAFGSIQSFANLFNNAHNISLGRILIISSIGASSVLLILFFLLDSLAKLTERSIASTHNAEAPLFERYPFIFLSHGILIIVALVGVALIISKHESFKEVWFGWWWALPLVWIALMILVVAISPVRIFRRKKQKDNKYRHRNFHNFKINIEK